MTSPDPIAELADGVLRLHAEGQGVWLIEVYPARWAMRLQAPLTDEEERVLGYFRYFADLMTRPGEPRRQCSSCGTEFGDGCWPGCLIGLHPDVPEPSEVVLQAACMPCTALGEAAVVSRACATFTESFGMDCRHLGPAHPAGHG